MLYRKELLLRRRDGVLCSLGYAELDHGLGLDLDQLAGLRVAADAGFALGVHQPAEAGDGEYAVLLGFLDRGLREQVKKSCRLLVGQFELFCQLPYEGCFGQCRHSGCSSWISFFIGMALKRESECVPVLFLAA